MIAISAVLARATAAPGLLDRHVDYTPGDLVPYSPVTTRHVGDGMRVSALCAAALQYSDNTAANLLLRLLGGPDAVTRFARTIGDPSFRLDRIETALNDAVPGDPRDTTTPEAMANSILRLAVGDGLAPPARAQLVDWMRGNTTGAARIRAGVPHDWTVADKTGSGDYGVTNDVGLVWPPGRAPIVIVVYIHGREKTAPYHSDIVASAAQIVVEILA